MPRVGGKGPRKVNPAGGLINQSAGSQLLFFSPVTPVMLSLTVYYIPPVKNGLLTSLPVVLCTKAIDVLVVIFQTTWRFQTSCRF